MVIKAPFRKRRLSRLLFVAGYVFIATLILLEVALRFWGYSEPHIYDSIYVPFNSDIPYVHKPNLVQARARGLAIIDTDSLGLRSKTSGARYNAKQTNEYRIAIVGDSVTFGEGVPKTEDTYAEVMERTLNAKQHSVKVKVFNYGASAYSVQTMAATLRHRMLDIDPDLALMAIYLSDFDLKRTPTVDGSGYLQDDRVARVNHLTSGLRWVIRRLRLSYVVHGVIYKWFVPPPDFRYLDDDLLPESYTYLKQFKETADAYRVRSLIVLLPRKQKTVIDRLRSELQTDNLPFLDLTSLGDALPAEEYYASRFDTHPSAAVHNAIGIALAEFILMKSKPYRSVEASNIQNAK